MQQGKYPRAGNWQAPKRNSGRKCSVCGDAPAGLLDIEVSIFRGEDLTVACCKKPECKRAAVENVRRGQQSMTPFKPEVSQNAKA